MQVRRCTNLAMVFGLLVLTPAAEGQSPTAIAADMASQAQKSRQATFRVDFRVVITAPPGTKQLRVWLPLAPSDGCQTVSDRSIETFPRPVEPSIHTEPRFGNRFAYFEFDSPQGAQQIIHQFTARISQLNWDVDYSRVTSPQQWPKSFAPYQSPDPRSDQASELNMVMQEINQANPSASQRLLGAMKWVDDNLTYDHEIASLTANPMHALKYRRGHCSDYHGLCGTLAREVGYPSRVLYGLQMFDKASPSHCKLEVFLPPYGWVTYDLSETQKLAIKAGEDPSFNADQRAARVDAIKDRTLKGFRENTWLMMTRGVHYDLAPPANRKVEIVRTIYAEADGVSLGVSDKADSDRQTFQSITMHRVDQVGDQARRFSVLSSP